MLRKAFVAALIIAAAVGRLPAASPVRSVQPPREPAARGLAVAELRCAACHGVAANRASPNPEAPPFEDIANRPGVTAETLQAFLRDSHNFPAAMNFSVEDAELGELADYIATLRKAGYRPVG